MSKVATTHVAARGAPSTGSWFLLVVGVAIITVMAVSVPHLLGGTGWLSGEKFLYLALIAYLGAALLYAGAAAWRHGNLLAGAGTTELEIELAQKLCRHVPSAQKVLLCNSGSEATYHARRVARAVTGRTKIIKFQGCYHGFHDAVLRNVSSPADKIGKLDAGSA